jgi:hypothetical protein
LDPATIGILLIGLIGMLNAYVVAEASKGDNPALVIASVMVGLFFISAGAYNVIARHRHKIQK